MWFLRPTLLQSDFFVKIEKRLNSISNNSITLLFVSLNTNTDIPAFEILE